MAFPVEPDIGDVPRQPEGKAAAIDQRPVVLRPVPDPRLPELCAAAHVRLSPCSSRAPRVKPIGAYCQQRHTEHTLEVLRRLRGRHPHPELVVLWDGASYHRARDVATLAEELRVTLVPLPRL